MRITDRLTFKGMNRDLAKDKRDNSLYWSARNLMIVNDGENANLATHHKDKEQFRFISISKSESQGANANWTLDYTYTGIANTKSITGTSVGFVTTEINQESLTIVGTKMMVDKLIVFLVSDNQITIVLSIDEFDTVDIKYIGQLSMSNTKSIEIVANVENANKQNVYWADGSNPLRKLNLADTTLMYITSNQIDQVPSITLLPPELIEVLEHGSFHEGTVLYCYSMKNSNGVSTKISAMSDPIDIHPGFDDDDYYTAFDSLVLTKSIKLTISNINIVDFNEINVYRLFYSTGDGQPEIKKIYINNLSSDTITIIDDQSNDSANETLTLNELYAIGGNVYIPTTIESKNGRLFSANIQSRAIDLSSFDSRAYSFNYNDSLIKVKNANGDEIITTSYDDIPMNHDSINPMHYNLDFQINSIPSHFNCAADTLTRHKKSSAHYGGSGKMLEFTIDRVARAKMHDYRTFKSGETYRLAIRFYDKSMNVSAPKWIADYTIPYFISDNISRTSLDNTNVNIIRVGLTSEGVMYASSNNLVMFEILIVDRKYNDSNILSQGVIQTSTSYAGHGSGSDEWSQVFGTDAYPFIRNKMIKKSGQTTAFDGGYESGLHMRYGSGQVNNSNTGGGEWDWTRISRPLIKKQIFYSPETINNVPIPEFSKIRPLCLLSGDSLTGFDDYHPNVSDNFNAQWDGTSLNGYDSGMADMEENIEYYGTLLIDKTTGLSHRKINNYDVIELDKSTKWTPDFSTSLTGNSRISLNNGYFVGGYSRFIFGAQSFSYSVKTGHGARGYGESNGCFVLEFKTYDWAAMPGSIVTPMDTWSTLVLYDAQTGIDSYSKFARDSELPNSNTTYLPIVEAIQDVTNRYGGYTFANKTMNEYLVVGKATYAADTNISYGDAYNVDYLFMRTFPRFGLSYGENYGMSRSMTFIKMRIESNINTYGQRDISREWNNTKTPQTNNTHYLVSNEATILDSALNKVGVISDVYAWLNSPLFQTLPYNFKPVSGFCNRIISSKRKFNNEEIDSWLRFEEGITFDLDSQYGCINKLYKFNDEIYAFQDKAVAFMLISPKAQTASDTGGTEIDILIGEGNVLHDKDYISTDSGCKTKFGIIDDGSSIYYYDKLNNSINSISIGDKRQKSQSTEITKLTGMHKYIKDYTKNNYDNIQEEPLNLSTGYVVAGFNKDLNNVYFTFNNRSNSELELVGNFSISFNTLTNTYISFHDFIPNSYIRNNNEFDLILKDQIFRLHEVPDKITDDFGVNTFGYNVPISLTLLHSRVESVVKRYDNIEFTPIVYIDYNPSASFTTMRCWNSYQDTTELPFSPSLQIRKHRSIIPRNFGTIDRMRDSHMFINLDYDGHEYKTVIHDIYLHFNSVIPLRNEQQA